MDKTFEDFITETLQEYNVDEHEEVDVETNDEADLDVEDSNEETIEDNASEEEFDETEEVDDSNSDEDLDIEEDEDTPSPSGNEKDVEAFIQLRQQNKMMKDEANKYKSIVDYFDTRAKQMGMSGIDEFVEKSKEAELRKNAENQGIPVDVLKKINDLEARVAEQDALRAADLRKQEENRLASTFDSFIQKNQLDGKGVEKLAADLTKDGINLKSLSSLPTNTVSRILESYLPKETQKQAALAKKEQIKKEMPVSSDSKSSTKGQEDHLDAIAKAFAGKN